LFRNIGAGLESAESRRAAVFIFFQIKSAHLQMVGGFHIISDEKRDCPAADEFEFYFRQIFQMSGPYTLRVSAAVFPVRVFFGDQDPLIDHILLKPFSSFPSAVMSAAGKSECAKQEE